MVNYEWWELALFALGAASFISVVIIIFLPVGDGQSEFTYTGALPDPIQPEFAEQFAAALNLPLERGNPVQLLNNGDEFLEALVADIDAATSSIHILNYIWHDGAMSDRIFSHLVKKAQEGVEVRVLVDAVGAGTRSPRARIDELENAGGRYLSFRSLSIAPWHLLKNRVRNHGRIVVVDGRIGYTGGSAIADEWLGDAQSPEEYRDTMFRSEGAMARNLQGAFNQFWTAMTGEILAGDSYFPDEVAAGGSVAYIPLTSTPSPDTQTLEKMILLSVHSAKQSVLITSPYFLTNDALRRVLTERVRAGVDVRILVPGDRIDVPSVRYASRYRYDELLESGVRLFEYEPTFIHSKAIVIDGVWSIIGSANMDFRSRKINEEIVFGVHDPVLGATLQKTFEDDLAHATEIRLEDWRRRGIWTRIRELTDLILVQQY